jgi:hypothetical protein
MKKTAVALSTLLAVGCAGGVLAQEQIDPPAISGTVQSVDPATRTVVLDNGQTYSMGDSADIGMLQTGSQVDLNCDTNGSNCMVVGSDMQNDVGPESGTQPSAGSNQGGTDDGGGTGTDTVPPGNTPTAPDSSGTGSDGGDMGGTSGSGSSN